MGPLSAKIFLSDQRGLIESDKLKRFCTFNFKSYFDEHKGPFGPLYLFNDEVLAGSTELYMEVEYASCSIVIPITGDLLYKEKTGNHVRIKIGQVLIINQSPGSSGTLLNPYEDDEINFLQIGIRDELAETEGYSICDFSLDRYRNRLIEIIPEGSDVHKRLPLRLCLGQFSGREEVLFKTRHPSSGFFSFVLAGAFEVEGRLLHPRDGLALMNFNDIELEALSDNATILAVELPGLDAMNTY